MQAEPNFWATLNLNRWHALGIIGASVVLSFIVGSITLILASSHKCKESIVDDGGPDIINKDCSRAWEVVGFAYGAAYGLFGSIASVVGKKYIDHQFEIRRRNTV